MNINETLKKATPGPLELESPNGWHHIMRIQDGIHHCICSARDESVMGGPFKAKPTMALLAHCYNHLPKVLEALVLAEEAMSGVCDCGECGGCVATIKIRAALTEASEVKT